MIDKTIKMHSNFFNSEMKFRKQRNYKSKKKKKKSSLPQISS